MNKTPLVFQAAAICALSFLTLSAEAATIYWGSASPITGNTDVSTEGSLIGAFDIGDAGVPGTAPINGVSFAPFALPTGDVTSTVTGAGVNFTITSVGGFLSDNGNFASGTGPFATLSAEYQDLLRSGSYADSFDPLVLTITGLTAGNQYQFQWWANYSGPGQDYTTATAGYSRTLLDNTGNAVNPPYGVGEYAIGAFTADSGTQVITFSPGNSPTGPINGFQLRAIPEPSTALSALALILVGVAARRRLRTQSESCATV